MGRVRRGSWRLMLRRRLRIDLRHRRRRLTLRFGLGLGSTSGTKVSQGQAGQAPDVPPADPNPTATTATTTSTAPACNPCTPAASDVPSAAATDGPPSTARGAAPSPDVDRDTVALGASVAIRVTDGEFLPTRNPRTVAPDPPPFVRAVGCLPVPCDASPTADLVSMAVGGVLGTAASLERKLH